MHPALEALLIYFTISSLAGGPYYIFLQVTTGQPTWKKLLLFILAFPPTWIALSVLLGAAGLYHSILPNNDTAFLYAALFSLLPAAILAHWGT